MTVFFIAGEMDAKETAEKDTIENKVTGTKSATVSDFSDDEDNIDIPGLKNIWGSKYTAIGKLIWMVILICCTVTMLIHVVNRVQHYLSLPVTVGIQIQNNVSMKYPDITVCHTEYWRKDLYAMLQNEIANVTDGTQASDILINDILQHMSIMELWKRVAFRLEDLITSCTIESIKPCTSVGKWQPVNSVLGICYTFHLDYRVNVSGNLYGLKMVLNTTSKTSAFKFLMHSSEDTPKAKMFTEGISVSTSFTTDIRVKLRQFRLKGTNAKPCTNTRMSACKVECLSASTLKTANCRLPFMDNVNAPYCAPPYHSVADKAVRNILLGKEIGCSCLPECHSDHYETSVDSTYYPENNITQVRIYYENFDFTIINEEFSYGFVPLVSDIGGTLGLFLGFSLLTIVELIATLIVRLQRSYRKKIALKKSEEHELNHNSEENNDAGHQNNDRY